MAAELVGTAYVRIRAITAGLASEIKDGVEKGAADADIDKAGKGLGEDLGATSSESFKGSMAEGVTDAFDSPEMHKASEEGGEGVARDAAKGIENENKRKNPFTSMFDALKSLSFGDAFKDKFQGINDELDSEFARHRHREADARRDGRRRLGRARPQPRRARHGGRRPRRRDQDR